jgi:hypothetical protein
MFRSVTFVGSYPQFTVSYRGTNKAFTLIDEGSQLLLARKYHLPLFLHSRAAHTDFVTILREEGFGVDGGRSLGAKGGVVHSFTGTAAEAAELVCKHGVIYYFGRPLSAYRWIWDFI